MKLTFIYFLYKIQSINYKIYANTNFYLTKRKNNAAIK